MNLNTKTMSVKQYLHNKEKLTYTTFIIKNGAGYYIENGTEIPSKDFEARYPLPTKIWMRDIRAFKGANPDKKRI
jgi:hypothetical protein